MYVDSYGRYKYVRDSAWQCLLDFQVTELPVDLFEIASVEGIKIVRNSVVNVLVKPVSGLSILKNGKWSIVYDDSCIFERRRFTVAHELGHIFLGHALVEGAYGRTFDANKPQRETEADMFAARLLAPACVLWGLNLHAAEEIAAVCSISLAAAQVRADRMKLLYARGKFLTSALECAVYEQFKPFVQKKNR